LVHSKDNLNSLPNNYIHDILEDSNGDLWIATRGGISKYDNQANKFDNFQSGTSTAKGLKSNRVSCLYEDKNWVATDKYGLILLDRTTNEYLVYQENEGDKSGIKASTIMDVDEDEAGNLLIATEGGGLNVLNLENFDKTAPQFAQYQVEPLNAYSINDNFLQSIYKDKAGLIWIGSKDSGINKIDKGIQKFTHYQSHQIAEGAYG